MTSLRMANTKRKSYVVVGNGGEICPRCGQSTEIREHAAITAKLLQQPSYYSRWFYCTNPKCQMRRIMPQRHLVWNGSAPSPWDV